MNLKLFKSNEHPKWESECRVKSCIGKCEEIICFQRDQGLLDVQKKENIVRGFLRKYLLQVKNIMCWKC